MPSVFGTVFGPVFGAVFGVVVPPSILCGVGSAQTTTATYTVMAGLPAYFGQPAGLTARGYTRLWHTEAGYPAWPHPFHTANPSGGWPATIDPNNCLSATNVTAIYQTPGTYTISLDVTPDGGVKTTHYQTVVVTPNTLPHYWFDATNGLDTNTGTQSEPFQSFGKLKTLLTAGGVWCTLLTPYVFPSNPFVGPNTIIDGVPSGGVYPTVTVATYPGFSTNSGTQNVAVRQLGFNAAGTVAGNTLVAPIGSESRAEGMTSYGSAIAIEFCTFDCLIQFFQAYAGDGNSAQFNIQTNPIAVQGQTNSGWGGSRQLFNFNVTLGSFGEATFRLDGIGTGAGFNAEWNYSRQNPLAGPYADKAIFDIRSCDGSVIANNAIGNAQIGTSSGHGTAGQSVTDLLIANNYFFSTVDEYSDGTSPGATIITLTGDTNAVTVTGNIFASLTTAGTAAVGITYFAGMQDIKVYGNAYATGLVPVALFGATPSGLVTDVGVGTAYVPPTPAPTPTLTVTAGSNQSAVAGTAHSFGLGSFTATNATAPFLVDVSWGDGSADTTFSAGTAGTIAAQAHTYLAPGTDTVSVTVSDANGYASNTATFAATVTGTPTPTPTPTATITATAPSNQAATVGAPVLVNLGSFTASNGTAPFAATIGWGDGSPNGTVSLSGTGPIGSLSHTFGSAGTDAVTVKVKDAAGYSSNLATFSVAVAAVTTIAVTPPPPQTGVAGIPVEFALGSFTAFNATSPFSVSVNWGDNSSPTTFNNATGTIAQQPHTFNASGSSTVTITVTDSASHSSAATFVATVIPQSPATVTPNYPATTDVRSGVNFGSGEVGQLVVPPNPYVLTGIVFDDGTHGTAVEPDPSVVQLSVVYGVGGNGSTGTLIVSGLTQQQLVAAIQQGLAAYGVPTASTLPAAVASGMLEFNGGGGSLTMANPYVVNQTTVHTTNVTES